MSFMSFDYAMRAAEAQLSFQDSQGRNMKDANERVSQVGTQNASSKDKLVRDKIQAEYEMKTTEIDSKLKDDLLKLAEEKKQNSMIAAAAVTIGTVAGGYLDHLLGEIGNAAGTDIGGQEVNPGAKALSADQQGGGFWDRGSDIAYSGQSTKDAYAAEKTSLETKIPQLTARCDELTTTNDKLRTTNTKLTEDNDALKGSIDKAKTNGATTIEFGGKTMSLADAESLFKKNVSTITANNIAIGTNTDELTKIQGPDGKGGELAAANSRLTFVEKQIEKQKDLKPEQTSMTAVQDLGNGNMGVMAYNQGTGDFMAFKVNKNDGTCTVGAMLSPDQVAKMTQDYLVEQGEFKRNDAGDIVIPKDSPYANLFVPQMKDGKVVTNPDGSTLLKTPAEFSAAGYQHGDVSTDLQSLVAATFRSETGKTAMQDYLRQTNESYTDEDASNTKVGGAVNPSAFNITPAYHDFAEKACGIVNTDGVRKQMMLEGMSEGQVKDLAGGWFQNKEILDHGTMFDKLQGSGAVTSTWQDIGKGTAKTMKALFKPIANAMQDFINLGKVYKEYSEEVEQANAQAAAAKRKAQAAKERLLAIEAALVAGH